MDAQLGRKCVDATEEEDGQDSNEEECNEDIEVCL